MGIFDFFRKNKTETSMPYARMLNNDVPIFSQFGDNIYASDVVQQALYVIVTEMKKLNPKHVRRKGFDIEPVWGNVQRALDNPNELMTKSDMLEKITWQVLLNYNAFIYIERDRASGAVTGLYPVSPTQVTFLDGGGRLFVQMLFRTGDSYTLPYDSFIHIKTHYSVSDLMGGNEAGQPDNDALLKTLGLNDTLLQGVQKALKSSFAINAIVKYNTMLDDGKIEQSIAEFESKLLASQSGIMGIDNKADVIQFKRDLATVDEATLAFIDDKILRHFGVPLAIVRGDYTTEQYEAFYQRTLEPLIINYCEAFTKRLFTKREQEGFENRIYFYPKELTFMSTSQTLQMVHELGQSGTLYENEKRVAFGYDPLPELVGVRLQSLNYVNVDDARQYQVGSTEVVDVTETVDDEDGSSIKHDALNGAQVQSMVSLIQSYKDGVLTHDQAVNIFMLAFNLSKDEAESIISGDKEIEGDNSDGQ